MRAAAPDKRQLSGTAPVPTSGWTSHAPRSVADQPEDALHAEFIEKHIVNTLRERRGVRQYIFSTRNANILVSGDAEQVFVLQSDAKRGWIQRTGSIDGFETRDLIMLNLEGGADAFSRRSQKYYVTPLT